MPTTDPRIDAYIAKSAPFARPILKHLRGLVHAACPDVVETMKWSFPHFDYKGMMCSMAAFKEHCAFGFWKGALILPKSDQPAEEGMGMGQFGRITSIDDLPNKKVLTGYIKQAMKLNDEGVKQPKAPKKEKAPLTVPAYFKAALKKNKNAQAHFDNFSPSKQREYVEWITEAKQEATRDKRLAQAIEWIAEGKARNWKYENC
jgi:uncharacterized protein YdeI (YjbR/CyaY-like superfamily)